MTNSTSKSTTLIFDSATPNGHHIEYLQYLINYIIMHRKNDNRKYYFVLHPDMVDSLTKYVVHLYGTTKFVQIELLKIDKLLKIKNTDSFYNRLHNSLILLKYLRSLADNLFASHIILMQVDTYQFSIGLKVIGNKKCSISGIFFYPGTANYKKLKNKTSYLKDYLKTFYVRWMLRNPYIDNIFILNDNKLVSSLNKYFSTSLFKLLEDPVSFATANENLSIHTIYDIPVDTTIFVTFGAMSPRKNVTTIVRSFGLLLKNTVPLKVRLLILGKFMNAAYKQEILNLIEEITAHEKQVVIQIDDRFLSNDEREIVFRDADVILIPYVDFQGSSGVLGHAARNKKPVIVSRGGLMEDLTNQYDLGYIVNSSDIKGIAEKMNEAIGYDAMKSRGADFLAEHSPAAFAEHLLSVY